MSNQSILVWFVFLKDGTAPLWIASQMGHSEVVRVMLLRGADRDATRKVSKLHLVGDTTNQHVVPSLHHNKCTVVQCIFIVPPWCTLAVYAAGWPDWPTFPHFDRHLGGQSIGLRLTSFASGLVL